MSTQHIVPSNFLKNKLLTNQSICIDAPTFSYRCLNDADWTMTYLNGKCETILDVKTTELLNNTVSFGRMIHHDDELIVRNIVQDALCKRNPFQVMYRLITPQGRKKLLFEQGEGVFEESGKLIELNGFITDISQLLSSNDINRSFELDECAKALLDTAFKQGLIRNKQFQITAREVDIAIYFCQGLTMKEIAHKFQLSNRTIEVYLMRIKSKLGCHTKIQLRKLFVMTPIGKKLIIETL